MRVFVAGATGAIGKQLVPRLVAAGHGVVGMTRKVSNRALLEELGATPVVADALDADQVADAVGRADPEVIVHELTAGAVMMTEIRGASNAKAKRDLGWQPRHRSWRQGFVEVARASQARHETEVA